MTAAETHARKPGELHSRREATRPESDRPSGWQDWMRHAGGSAGERASWVGGRGGRAAEAGIQLCAAGPARRRRRRQRAIRTRGDGAKRPMMADRAERDHAGIVRAAEGGGSGETATPRVLPGKAVRTRMHASGALCGSEGRASDGLDGGVLAPGRRCPVVSDADWAPHARTHLPAGIHVSANQRRCGAAGRRAAAGESLPRTPAGQPRRRRYLVGTLRAAQCEPSRGVGARVPARRVLGAGARATQPRTKSSQNAARGGQSCQRKSLRLGVRTRRQGSDKNADCATVCGRHREEAGTGCMPRPRHMSGRARSQGQTVGLPSRDATRR